MRQVILAIFIALLFISDALAKQPTTKAIYGIPLGSGVFKNKTPRQTAQYLKACGINAVVDVPLDNSLIDELHRQGIKAYAQLPMFCGKEYWLKHPESRPLMADGNFIEEYGWYAGVCVSQEWLIKQKIDEAEDLIKKYAIDGLWLDFIRWPARWDVESPEILDTCFCKSCLERFQKETGIKLPEKLKLTKDISDWIYKNYSRNWYAWRSDVIADTVCRIRQVLKKYSKDAIMGIFLVPWGKEDYDNAIYRVIGQDVAKLSKCTDVFSPMSYNLICYRDTQWITSINRQISSQTRRAVWPIVQATDEPRQMSIDEYAQVLNAGLAGGSSGVVVFNTEAALKPGKWQVQKDIFVRSE